MSPPRFHSLAAAVLRALRPWPGALAAALALAGPAAPQAPPRPETCARCHLEQQVPRLREPAEQFPSDVHAEKGFSCLDCHGALRERPGAGFMAKPTRQEIPQLCGRCHSNAAFMRRFNPSLRVDQVTEYYSSRHGERLREANDPQVATCTSCHPAHRTRPPSDPTSTVFPGNVAETCGGCHAERWMSERGLPIDQLEQFRASVHGRMLLEHGDLSAPTCNDCHGNHGAAPPGVESVRNVCGQCHATIAEFFDDSGHEQPFAEGGLPGCATCHGKHDISEPDDDALGLRNELVCGRCHAAGDTIGNEFTLMQVLLDSLQHEREQSRAILHRAENAGMEVSEALFRLEDANDAVVRARAAIHAFRMEPMREEIEAGLAVTDIAARRGAAALEEHGFRRAGLAVSTTLILILVFGLLLRIRELDRTDRRKTEAP
ncbi:MAG TPA: cytochrome c3 family protein [Longimicrobiales bacterium]|nr:cytochrome c3 family protein [Longimicrobiales bacterium]